MPARVLIILVLLALPFRAATGQELEPRLLANVPPGMQFAVLAYAYSQGNILRDPAVPLLGTNRNYAYVSRPLRVMPDETIVLFTPGCLNVANADGEPLGQDRLAEALCDGFGISATDAGSNLLGDLGGFFKDGR